MWGACALASSGVTRPSRRPRTPADAPLEVASATNPRPASTRAEPASQGFAITKADGPSWSFLKRAALSACDAVTARRPRPCSPWAASPEKEAGNSRRAPRRGPRAKPASVASSSCPHSFHELQDVVEAKAAPLQETHLLAALAIVRGSRGEAACPHPLHARRPIGARLLERDGDGLVANALGAQLVGHLERPEAPCLGANRKLRVARVGKPALVGELIEEGLDVLAFDGDERE